MIDILIDATKQYFKGRPHIDCSTNRVIFEAGFLCGWDKLTCQDIPPLTDAQIIAIAESMPACGTSQFMEDDAQLIQFARALEAAQTVQNET